MVSSSLNALSVLNSNLICFSCAAFNWITWLPPGRKNGSESGKPADSEFRKKSRVNSTVSVRAVDSFSHWEMAPGPMAIQLPLLITYSLLAIRTVDFYAREMNITSKYLSEILLSEIGKPAKTLIDDTVFLEAKTLLRQTTMSVQEIANWLNFPETSNFIKAFKKRENLTPAAYRKHE